MNFNISGRTALVTGGAGLLGSFHARALAQINGNVVIADIDEGNLTQVTEMIRSEHPGSNIHPVIMDVTSEQSIVKASEVICKLGYRVDILVNNAALNPTSSSMEGNRRTTRLENFSLERWNLELAVGLTGAFLCSKVFGTKMASDGLGGVILNIASDLSVIAPDQRIYEQKGLPDHLQAVKPGHILQLNLASSD